ncbi:hypothetical protein RDI58_021046 [Solanum bulbocastanum]|uniref:Uncharacterized protein n=1 Tax=Solanum bulbocastanum TaxID=147425 RepID=A0AAN8Y8B6_SOLBU
MKAWNTLECLVLIVMPLFSRLWRLLNHKLTLILDRKEKRKPSLQACKRFNIILPTEVSSTLEFGNRCMLLFSSYDAAKITWFICVVLS